MEQLTNIPGLFRKFRYVTPDRFGKWYDDLVEAQRNSVRIGAGFYDDRTGAFFAYPGTKLEVLDLPQDPESFTRPAFRFGGDAAAAA